jgi:hypothetical protein
MNFSDCIEKVSRRLEPTTGACLALLADYTAGSGTITLDHASLAFNGVQPGVMLSIGLNQIRVLGSPNVSTGVTTVVGGQQGSTDANVDYDATPTPLAYINPRFSRWDISVAINDELQALTTPKQGIGKIDTWDTNFVPVYMGYDLGPNFDSVRSRVLEISFALPAPMRQNPLIRRGDYRVIRATNQPSIFPNGNGVLIYKDAFVGFPIHVTFIAPFSPLVSLTDDLDTVAGVPVYMQDIVDMGAELRLAPDREIERNSLSFQRDPRKAPEVPATAVMNSTNALQRRYQGRIDDEASNIKRAYKNSEGF